MQIAEEQSLVSSARAETTTKAGQADNELPDQVDTDKHAAILQRLGIDPQDLLGQLGGLGGKLGL